MQLIGKIPTMPEFVTPRAYGVWDSLEAWAEDGIAYCRGELGALLEERYDNGLPQCFVWESGAGVTLAGLAFPSHDSVGRKFPFIIGTDISSVLGGHVAVAPVALGDFLESAFVAGNEILKMTDRRAIRARVEEIRKPAREDFGAAEAEYHGWLDATPLSQAWRSLGSTSPAQDGPQRIDAALEVARRRAMVRILLGEGGTAGSAALWTEVLTRGFRAPTSVFWSVDGTSFFASFEPPAPPTFAAVFLRLDDLDPRDADKAPVSLCDDAAPVSRMLQQLDTQGKLTP